MESAGKRVQANCKKPVPRSGHVAVTYGSIMLVWGGYNELPWYDATENQDSADQYLDGKELWCYNIEAQIWDVWHTRSSPPGMSGSCAACVGKHMYLFGGFNSTGNSNELYRLDLKTRIWKHLKPEGKAPSPRDKATCWPYEDKLVFFGGFGPPPDDEEVTSRKQDMWSIDAASSRLWSNMPARGWNNHLFVYSITDNSWNHVNAKPNQPCPRAAHATAVIGNRGFLFGGRFEASRMNDLHVLNLETMSWSGSCSPASVEVPEGRSWHCMAAVSNRHFLLYGGYSSDGQPLNDVWVFDVDSRTWYQQESLCSDTRLWHTGVSGVDAGEAVIFGGCCNDLLDPEERSVHSSKVLSFYFSPRSLARLSSESVVKHIDVLSNEVSCLPTMLRTKIKLCLRSEGLPAHSHNLRSRPQNL